MMVAAVNETDVFTNQRIEAQSGRSTMTHYTDLDVMAIHRYDIDSRAIELERALEGAWFENIGRGMKRKIRAARGRADLDWNRHLFIDRRAA